MDVKVVSQEMASLSNMLVAYTFIADHPERTALVFLGGVCIGLLVTLCSVVFQIHCRADFRHGSNHHQHGDHGNHHYVDRPCRRQPQSCLRHHETGKRNQDDTVAVVDAGAHGQSEGWDDMTSQLTAQRQRHVERNLQHAKELERTQQLEERERILREIWMDGQSDHISTVTRNLNTYY